MEINLTEREAYAAMYEYLVMLYKRTRSDDLGGLLGDMSILQDGGTADPAVWIDWLQCINQVKTKKNNIDLSIQPMED